MRVLLPFVIGLLALPAQTRAAENVPLSPFRAVELHGGGSIILVPSSVQRIALEEGSSQITRFRVDQEGKLVIDACSRQCPPAYRLRMRIETPQLLGIGVNGGGMITAGNGFAPQKSLGVAVKGGGKIDVRSIDVGNVGASVSGGGAILVTARRSLAAAVNGGGEIRYSGNPAVTMAINGGGNVRRSN